MVDRDDVLAAALALPPERRGFDEDGQLFWSSPETATLVRERPHLTATATLVALMELVGVAAPQQFDVADSHDRDQLRRVVAEADLLLSILRLEIHEKDERGGRDDTDGIADEEPRP